MEHIVTVNSINERNEALVINTGLAEKIGLLGKQIAYLSFGGAKHYVRIERSDGLPEGNVLISHRIVERMHLPEYPVYEIKARQNAICLGPYIGLLLSKRDRALTPAKLDRLRIYLKDYLQLRGAVVFFALDKIDTAERLITGHCYNPVQNSFQTGAFPYPSAIYRTVGMGAKLKNHLLNEIGDRIFNSRYFSKWDMYRWFSGHPLIGRRIPYTRLYQGPQDISDMLEKYRAVYIKPVFGLGGRGISRASLEGEGILLRTRENGRNIEINLAGRREAEAYFQSRYAAGRYLLQQGLDLIKYRGRVVDFRCIMQKNQACEWVCMAIIGRCGQEDSIVSNISSGGIAFRFSEIAQIPLPIADPDRLEVEIRQFAQVVCSALDNCGVNCGTLGLDVGVDTYGRLWLIEINNRDPDPSIALNIKDASLYRQLKSQPLFYAKYLAGFGPSADPPV